MKRVRPVVALLILITIVWIGHQIAWHASAEPAETIDYGARLVELTGSHQPEGENGWPLLMEALTIHAQVEQMIVDREFAPRDQYEGGLPDYNRTRGREFDLEFLERERLAVQLLREQGAFDRLEEAARAPKLVRPMTTASPLYTMRLPELSEMRGLAKACASAMRFAAYTGDEDALVGGFADIMTLARASAAQPPFISYLVGLAIGSLAFDELRQLLIEHHPKPDTCRRLLEQLDPPLTPTAINLEGERICNLDAIQWCFTDDGHGDGRLDMSKFNTIAFAAAPGGVPGAFAGMFVAGRAETTDKLNEFFDSCIAKSKVTPQERESVGFNADNWVETLPERHVFLRMFLPAIDRSIHQRDRHEMQERSLRIMIALEIHRGTHGVYPERLDELVPDVLPEMPIDPFGNGPFVYRRDGEAYLLYSTGRDGVDDSADVTGPIDRQLMPGTMHHNVNLEGYDVPITVLRDTWE